jgi:hypothetical protein
MFPRSVWVWRGIVIGAFIAAFGAAVVSAQTAEVLFPQPLHIVRRIEDPVAKTTLTVHEYCAGDRIVTVNGARVAIADYGRQTLTEIDKDAGTYSVTRFEEIAAGHNALAPKRNDHADDWKTTPIGMKRAQSGRSADAFELVRNDHKIELSVDRSTRVSRAALDVLIGAAYPFTRRSEHEAIVRAAGGGRERSVTAMSAGSAAPAETFALPVEQVFTIEVAGELLTMRNAVLEIRNEPPPDDVQRIPPGATLVESRTTRAARELRDLDQLPSSSKP